MGHKGIVVEIAPKNKVIILTSSGEFIKVPLRKHVQVGQEIRYKPKRERLSVWQLGLAATLFLALVSSWPLISAYLNPVPEAPAFTITVDLNSSLELQVSAAERVLAVEGLNRDGKELAARLDVVGDELSAALKSIAQQAERAGYLQQGQDAVVTVASQQEGSSAPREKRVGSYTELEQAIVDALRGSGTRLADVRLWEVPRSVQAEAKLAGITPSRYIAIQMPAAPSIPAKIDTRLTMSDPPEPETSVGELVRTSIAERVMEPSRPSLTPTRWTKREIEPAGGSLYNVNFPIAAVKGDF